VLFCGGLGMRMREGASDVPKPMAIIGDRAVALGTSCGITRISAITTLCSASGTARRSSRTTSCINDETLSQRLHDGRRRPRREALLVGYQRLEHHVHHRHRPELDDRRAAHTGCASTSRTSRCSWANYADTLTDAPLDEMITAFDNADSTASMLAVPPFSSHHVVQIDDAGQVTVQSASSTSSRSGENGGYFVMRPGIFDGSPGWCSGAHSVTRARLRIEAQDAPFHERAEQQALAVPGDAPHRTVIGACDEDELPAP